MTIRPEAQYIIDYVAALANDTAHVNISAQQIQDALDNSRIELRYAVLEPVVSFASGGVQTYVTFCSAEDRKWLETDGFIVDSGYDTIAPSDADWKNGRWIFATEPSRNVMLTGWSHDPYAAACEVLNIRAGQLSEKLKSFSGQNGSFSYASMDKSVKQLAAMYCKKSRSNRPKTVRMVRVDMQ